MTFGEKLQKLRARAGLSQDALAELLDVSRQAVSKWERNEAMPEAEKIVRISRQFGVSTDYLLLEEQEEPETASAPAPAASLWVRVKQWCRNRGYLLAWALAAWGIWRLGVIVVSLIRSYLTLDKIPGFDLERYLVSIFGAVDKVSSENVQWEYGQKKRRPLASFHGPYQPLQVQSGR